MPTFSKRSQERLLSCHGTLIKLFNEVVKYYDCTIISGNRNEEEQNDLYDRGLSRLRYPNSKHNEYPSAAVDVAPYLKWRDPHIDWDDREGFYHFIGYVKGVADQLGIKIRSGADWDMDLDFHDQEFFDLVHFELVNPGLDRV